MTVRIRKLIPILVLAATYLGAGQVAVWLTFAHVSASAVWPPSGIALAALLLWGHRLWPGVFIGAFVLNVVAVDSLGAALAIATGNTLEAVFAALLINRFANGREAFERAKDIFRFALAASVSTVISATVGATSLTVAGLAPWNQYFLLWRTWWLGDTVGELIIAPLILIWATQPFPQWFRGRGLEGAGLLLSLAVIGYLVFLGRIPSGMEHLAILPLLWAALRFGQHATVGSAFVLSAFALVGALHGLGPFATPDDPNLSLLLLQTFAGTITTATLMLAAVISERNLERNEATELSRESQHRFRQLTENLQQVFWMADQRKPEMLYISPAYERIWGRTCKSLYDTPASFIESIHPEDRELVVQTMQRQMRGETTDTEYRVIRADQSIRWVRDRGFPIRDETGRVYRVAGIADDITEQKRAQESLSESQKELADFFDNASLPLHWVGPDGIILRVNRAELRMLGYSEEEYIGHHIAEFHVGSENIQTILRRLLAGESLEEYPARMRCKDGSIRDVLIDSNVYRKGGQFIHTRCFTRDVTELKRAEEARARLAAVVESSADAIISKDLDGIITSWNAGAERLFGHTAQEMLGQPITRIIPPEKRDEELSILSALRRGERLETYETVRVGKNGQLVAVSLTISPVKDATGRIIGISKIARDISGRKLAERQLRERAHQQQTLYELVNRLNRATSVAEIYQSALDTLITGLGAERASILLLDEANVMRFKVWRGLSDTYRKAVEGHTPWSPGELNPQPVCVDNIGSIPLEEALRGVIQREGIGAFAFIPLLYSGKLVGKFMVYYNAPHAFTAEEVQLSQAIASQLAFGIERKRAEEELQRLNLELEERVNLRTRDLLRSISEREKLQEELLQAQKLESVGTLAGGVAHDFNNILNIIGGYTELIKRAGSDPIQLAKSAEVIHETINRGASLVRQLLSFVRKTGNKIEPLDLKEVLEKLYVILRETFPKEIQTSIHLNPGVHTVLADRNQLSQALLNLCVNARDAMPQGGKLELTTGFVLGSELSGRFKEARHDQRYALISVSDTGAGIPPGLINRIFDPFFTTKDIGHGTGLGLSVVYGIVANHAGFIDVISAPEQGSTFQVYLPLAQEPIVEGDTAANDEEHISVGNAETILLVEDEVKQVELMQTFLASHGYRVIAALDGLEAVETYLKRKNDIALVILDLGLPKLNGCEVLRKIKNINPAVRVILATGYMTEDAEVFSEHGELTTITKPYQLDDVLRKVGTAIDATKQLSRSPTGDHEPPALEENARFRPG